MNQKKKTAAILFNSLYAIVLFLFFTDWYTCVEIKSEPLKSFAYWGLLAGTPLTIASNAILFRKGLKKGIALTIPALVALFIYTKDPMFILIRKGSWKTQFIAYQNKNSTNSTIEFQMKDIGAFGYAKRYVKAYRLASLLIIAEQVDFKPENNTGWIKVDKEVNELELKYP